MTLIRITKNLVDVPEWYRPFKGKVFEVVETICGRYKPQENYRQVIEIKGQRIALHSTEYEVVRA